MDNNFNQEQQTYQGYSQEQQPYQQQPSQDFARVQQSYEAPYTEEPITFGDWMLTELILCIPIVGLVMMFVWAFGNGKKSKSNIFKAKLVWVVIQTVLSIILIIVYVAFIAAMLSETGYLY